MNIFFVEAVVWSCGCHFGYFRLSEVRVFAAKLGICDVELNLRISGFKYSKF
jgi:hypothetical protein